MVMDSAATDVLLPWVAQQGSVCFDWGEMLLSEVVEEIVSGLRFVWKGDGRFRLLAIKKG
jgi:hypothetical protein